MPLWSRDLLVPCGPCARNLWEFLTGRQSPGLVGLYIEASPNFIIIPAPFPFESMKMNMKNIQNPWFLLGILFFVNGKSFLQDTWPNWSQPTDLALDWSAHLRVAFWRQNGQHGQHGRMLLMWLLDVTRTAHTPEWSTLHPYSVIWKAIICEVSNF